MLLSFGGQADTYVGDLHTYFGAGNPAMTNFTLYLEVVTPHGTYYGTYQEPSQRLNTGNITNIYWSDTTGTIHAPRLNMGAASGAGSIGPCPGVHDAPNTSTWGCYSTNISVYVDQPVGGCLDHWDHHAGDNLFLAKIALRLAHFCQQVVNDSVFFFLRLTFAVFFITPETEAVLLTKAVGLRC